MANDHIALHRQVTIDSSNKYLDYDLGGGAASVTMDEATYDHMGDVCANLETKLQAVDGTFTVTIDTEGKVTIARTGNFDLLWFSGSHGSNIMGVGTDDHCGTVLGFDDSADDSGAATYTSDDQHTLAWYAEKAPLFDSKDRPFEIGPATFIPNDGDAERTNTGSQTRRRVDLVQIQAAKFLDADSPTNEDFETLWIAIANGEEFTLFTDTSSYPFTEAGQYKLIVGKDATLLDVARLSPCAEFYGPIEMFMIKQ